MNADRLSVGVVMPVRNGASTIAAAIRSVCEQQPPPTDIVVVDGSSEDGSASLAAVFPGVRVISQVGLGLAAARNQGIDAVAGNVIAFCDADDCWTTGALACRLDHLAREPGCDAVIGHAQRVPIEGHGTTPQQASRLGRVTPGYTPGALMVRRGVFEVLGTFDENLAIGADSDWFVRLAQTSLRLDVLPELVLQKGARASSLSVDVATYRSELLGVARRFVDQRRSKS